ncbi:MAG: hypothetical protein ACRDQ1_06340 [Sciscionella sp.]
MIRRLLVVCVALACSVSLAACNQKNSPSANPSASAPLGGVPLSRAENVATGWITALNQATVSGDTSDLKKFGTAACAVCTDFAHKLDVIYAAGGHVATKGWTVQSILPESGGTAARPVFLVKATSAPQTVVTSKGATPSKLTGGALQLRMILVQAGNTWKIERIDV